jgi:broad specificity phosphatase PhoE
LIMLATAQAIAAVVGAVLTAAAAAVKVVAFFSPRAGDRLMSWLRGTPTYDWPRVPQRISRAKNRVLILQTWFPALQAELPRWRDALAKGGIEFRVLLGDQTVGELRLRSRDPVSNLLIPNVSEIRQLIDSLTQSEESKPQVKFYHMLPFGPIYVIDEKIYWGLYLSHLDSMDGPVFQTSASSRLGKEIIKSFERAWEEASDRIGLLSVSEALDGETRDHTQEEVEVARRASIASQQARRIAAPAASELNAEGGYLCILRHADTDLNRADIITGGLDVGINAIGRRRMRELRDQFEREKWNAVYSGPARRYTETLAELLADPAAIQIREELRERAMGELEGFSRSDYSESLPRYDGEELFGAFHLSPNGGESYCDVFSRVAPFIEQILEGLRRGERTLICTHDTVIRMIRLLLENMSIKDALAVEIDNGDPFYYAAAPAPNPHG